MTRGDIFYVLRNGKPVAVHDVLAWAKWFEKSDDERTVAVTKLLDQGACHTRISTCFLAINQNLASDPPILWETAIFHLVPEYDVDVVRRYTSRLDAIAGHHRVVAEVVERIAKSLGRNPEVVYIEQGAD